MNIVSVHDRTPQNSDKLKEQIEQNQVEATLNFGCILGKFHLLK